jgi:hypothetical protein
MANYRFFNILHPEEIGDPLFPVLDSNFVPEFTPDDGDEIESFPVRGMFVLGNGSENKLKILSGSKDLKGTLWITSQRVIVVCRNYDQVKWDRTNSANTAFFGIGTEVTWHLAEKAVHKIKSTGKAMASHVYFPWIESIECRPEQGRKIPANLRFGIFLELTTGRLPLHLELQFDSGVDTADLVRNVLQRKARWYLSGPVELTDEQRQTATRQAANLTLKQYDGGTKYTTFHSVALRSENTPLAVSERVRAANDRARVIREAEEAKVKSFIMNIANCRPNCELVEATEEGREVFTSELGVVITRGSGVKAVPTETTLLHLSGKLHGSYRADPDTGAPVEQGTLLLLHQGQAQMLVTDKRIVVVTKAYTAAGDLSGKRAGVLIASTPIENIDLVARFKSLIPQRSVLDISIVSSDLIWGAIYAMSINGERASDGEWTYEEQDLAEATLRIATAVAHARGLPTPQLGEGNLRFAYQLAGAK